MKFYPTSRYIAVQPTEEQKDDTTIDLFDSAYTAEFTVCTVLEVGPGVNKDLRPGQTIAVEKHMLRSIKIDEDQFWFVLDNYVVGRLVDA